MMAAAIPLLLALTWGGTRYPWTSPIIIALLAGSLVLSLAFAWHLPRAPEPFLPISVLANPVMRMGTAASSFAMAVSIALTIFVPLYYEVVHKLSASAAGLALIPLALTTPGSILSGRALIRGRQYKWVPMVGLACGIVALAGLTVWPAAPLWVAIFVLCVVGTAIGTVYPVATVSIQNAVPHAQVGIAMGAMNFFRALASALLVAIMGAIVLAAFGATPSAAFFFCVRLLRSACLSCRRGAANGGVSRVDSCSSRSVRSALHLHISHCASRAVDGSGDQPGRTTGRRADPADARFR